MCILLCVPEFVVDFGGPVGGPFPAPFSSPFCLQGWSVTPGGIVQSGRTSNAAGSVFLDRVRNMNCKVVIGNVGKTRHLPSFLHRIIRWHPSPFAQLPVFSTSLQ